MHPELLADALTGADVAKWLGYFTVKRALEKKAMRAAEGEARAKSALTSKGKR